ncbi:DNA replication complex GINS protein PSF2 [Fimicolochytrium jonesii]|uniref:DNA replication complex GINS protein PSF2 n=1 Tax=Fimicolochytrium jonesii TaxID=1396493 RepID=UPI0022FDEF8D|nr:DNA replication complex GINS protein PSF2 [Fimicolochytrium jonesii]KAI8826924.1 DNA replication complex GINS protein PSF2 [Fimicolochytrium jonesii]
MALPKNMRNAFTPAEIEFLAESDTISIIPRQRMDQLQLINGSFGPFRPPIKQDVPVWLAITLKQKHKCQIQPPNWMDVEFLREKIEEENANEEFSALPFRYMETAHLLLACASDDVPQADLVRTLLKDLREARQRKARQGLQALDPYYLQMDNLGLMEINEIRPFFSKAFNELRRLVPSDASDSQATTAALIG